MATPILQTAAGKQALASLPAQQQQRARNALAVPQAQRTAQQKAAVQALFAARNSIQAPKPAGGVAGPRPGGAPAGGRPGGGAPAAGGGANWYQDFLSGGSYAPIVNDPNKLSQVLAKGGYTGSLDEQLRAAMLGSAFAGVEQWQQNQAGNTSLAEGNPSLQNVSFALDQNQLNRVVGQIQDDLMRGRDPAATMQGRNEYVAPWAQGVWDNLVGEDVYGQLQDVSSRGSGLAFDLGPLSSPGINLTDPSKPLFDPTSNPYSLLGMTGGGQGERSFLSTLSAEEFMNQYLPAYRSYYNRGAGEAAPFAGMMFGQLSENPDWNVPGAPNWVENGTPYREPHPVRDSGGYARWSAYGQPGNFTADDPFAYGGVNHAGSSYNPFLNTGSADPRTAFGQGILSGAVLPQHLAPFGSSWQDDAYEDLLLSEFGRVGTAAFLQDPSIWFQGPNEGFAPGDIGAEAFARLAALAGLGAAGGEV
jgi:hypothetical protein